MKFQFERAPDYSEALSPLLFRQKIGKFVEYAETDVTTGPPARKDVGRVYNESSDLFYR